MVVAELVCVLFVFHRALGCGVDVRGPCHHDLPACHIPVGGAAVAGVLGVVRGVLDSSKDRIDGGETRAY